ncbi:MAG: hypothetical protein KatS3mg034_0908 [Vicingaceae bacterium]|jgi:four helix bundle protein|nr:MAG: hypothetical protein KatS3mg034_0908 [Vicingaceae bacterium]
MFDFEKLDVYQLVKDLNVKVLNYLSSSDLDDYFKNELRKSTLNIVLNLAEGTGRRTFSDKRYFYTRARSAVFESVALLDVLKTAGKVSETDYNEFYGLYEQASKMLLGMVKSFSGKGRRKREDNEESENYQEEENYNTY